MDRSRDKSRIVRHVFATCLFMSLWGLSALLCHAGTEAAGLHAFAEISVTGPTGTTYNDMQLLDDRYTTKLELPKGTEITIRTQEKIHGLYLIWDKPPGHWALQAQEGSRTSMYLQGKNGWIHEYVALDEPSSAIVLVMPDTDVVLCEIELYGQGTLPDSVQVWDPPHEDADMLLLPTHADDEHLFFGGTMPYYAGELDYKVQVAYLTNHWAEPYRPHELLNGLWAVGIRSYPIFGEFPDYYSDNLEHAKTLYDLDQVFAYQVELLRRFQPEVVVGHDTGGEYGHGVHMLNAWVLQQAVSLAADETYLPDQVAEWGTFEVSKVYLHLYPEGAVLMDWNIPLENFGGRTAFEMAEAGFAQHLSQQKWFSVRTEGVHDCRAFGLYYTAVGDDSLEASPDFFQNIDTFSDDVIPEEIVSEDGGTPPEDPGESAAVPKSFLHEPGGSLAMILTGILACIFVVFLLWGRNRNRR
ncbi:MAG TPA: hypothetical protein DF480_04800 [Clostridiales bacterium]|nr:hypothetical protein [Clostridiales bacterium]